MSEQLDPQPSSEDVITALKKINASWYRWLYALWSRVQANTQLVAADELDSQGATIAATTLFSVSQTSDYRLTAYTRVTRAGTLTGTTTLTFTWTDDAVVCTKSFPIVNGNTTTTTDSNTWQVRADGGTDLKYGVVYTSTGATSMLFKLDVTAEWVN